MTRNENKSNLIEQIRSDLSNTTDAILNHPYLYELEKKEISKVKLEIFVCEQYHIITNDKSRTRTTSKGTLRHYKIDT